MKQAPWRVPWVPHCSQLPDLSYRELCASFGIDMSVVKTPKMEEKG